MGNVEKPPAVLDSESKGIGNCTTEPFDTLRVSGFPPLMVSLSNHVNSGSSVVNISSQETRKNLSFSSSPPVYS